MLTEIYNADILLPGSRWLRGGSLLIEDSRIKAVLPAEAEKPDVDRRFDARGGCLIPGAIDLHCHGGGGADFMEATPEAFATAIATHRRHGTTSLLPTLASASTDNIRQAAEVCTAIMADPTNGILGMRLEGPYFQPSMAGGQIPENIRLPKPEEYVELVESYPCIRIWDSAPELPGACDFARFLRSRGVVPALGHTKAAYPEVEAAAEAGYGLATHFYNAMTAVHKEGIYKHEGTVESVYLFDSINVEVIADGIHVPPVIIRMIHKMKGSQRMCLVTDSQACTDSDRNGAFDPRVVIRDGVCMLRDGSAIAGSVATMDLLVRTAVQKARLPLEEVSRLVSETPARLVGVYDCKGSIEPGKDADLMIFDSDLRLTAVFAMGREIEL